MLLCVWFYCIHGLYRYGIEKQWGKILFYSDGNINRLSLLKSCGELKKITGSCH